MLSLLQSLQFHESFSGQRVSVIDGLVVNPSKQSETDYIISPAQCVSSAYLLNKRELYTDEKQMEEFNSSAIIKEFVEHYSVKLAGYEVGVGMGVICAIERDSAGVAEILASIHKDFALYCTNFIVHPALAKNRIDYVIAKQNFLYKYNDLIEK